MEKPQIPVAILVRVSTAKQETARQISELRQYAGGKGYEVLEVCEETISGSAGDDERHGLHRAAQLARDGHIRKVLVHEISRIARRNSVAHAHPFPFADGDLAIAEIDVFDAETQTLEQAQAAPIQEMSHEAVVAFQVGKDGTGFGAGEDDGQLRRPTDALDPVNVFEFSIKDLPIEEKQSAEGLVLMNGIPAVHRLPSPTGPSMSHRSPAGSIG